MRGRIFSSVIIFIGVSLLIFSFLAIFKSLFYIAEMKKGCNYDCVCEEGEKEADCPDCSYNFSDKNCPEEEAKYIGKHLCSHTYCGELCSEICTEISEKGRYLPKTKDEVDELINKFIESNCSFIIDPCEYFNCSTTPCIKCQITNGKVVC